MTWQERGGAVVRNLMVDLGLKDFQAAGLVGNLGFESGGVTKLHEIGQPEGKGGYGWAQWTGTRHTTFFAWCDQHGLDWQSNEGNYTYLLHELNGVYHITLDALRKTSTLEDAVFSVGQTYERPGGTTPTHLPGYDSRLKYAQEALAGVGTPAPTPGAVDDITPFDRIKALQVVLQVKPDGAFGRNSRASLNELLRAASQPGI